MKTKICPLCNNEIPYKENICRYCLNDVTESKFLYRNYGTYTYRLKKLPPLIKDSKTNDSYSNVLPIRIWFILMIVTLGLYKYYWFYKNSKLIGENNPSIRSIIFIIPILNWIVYYKLLKDMQKTIKSANIETFSILPNFLFYFFIPILNWWSMINVQENMNEYWRKIQNSKERRKLTKKEQIIIIIFVIFYLLIILCIIFSLKLIL